MKMKSILALAALAVATAASASTNYVAQARHDRRLACSVRKMTADPELAEPGAFRACLVAFDEACATSSVTYSFVGLVRCCPKTVRKEMEASEEYSPAVKSAMLALCSYDAGNVGVMLAPGEEGYVNAALQDVCTGRPNPGQVKNVILRQCVVPVRKQIRAAGGSFVGKEGGKAVKERLDRIAEALNAPKMGNAGELLNELGFGVEWEFVQSRILTDAETEAARRRLMDGEIPFTVDLQNRLCLSMGVTAYNAFVREYNGK